MPLVLKTYEKIKIFKLASLDLVQGDVDTSLNQIQGGFYQTNKANHNIFSMLKKRKK